MAATLTVDELRQRLRSPEGVKSDPFAVLKSIAALVNVEESQSIGRDMLLRALEWRAQFGSSGEVLDSMARSTGLFPYANPESLSLPDLIAYEFHRPENLGDQIVF